MAELVAGFLMPHDPLMAALPDAPEPERLAAIRTAFAALSARLSDLEVDTIITIGDDHYAMFGPACIPPCFIAIGDVDGPLEAWLGIERAPIPNHEALATHMLHTGLADGIGWAFAKSVVVDHSTAVPYRLCYEPARPGVRVIPVYLNDGVPPFIPNRMAYAAGQSIARAISTWPRNERIAIVGTGGCSHWVGSPEMGSVNEDFDARLLDLVRNGKIDELLALRDADVLREGGNGAIEFKNWLCAMGAAGHDRTKLIAYAAVPQWISGIAFAELAST